MTDGQYIGIEDYTEIYPGGSVGFFVRQRVTDNTFIGHWTAATKSFEIGMDKSLSIISTLDSVENYLETLGDYKNEDIPDIIDQILILEGEINEKTSN